MSKFLREFAEKKEAERLSNIRQHIRELAVRGTISYEEYNDLRMNSYEREHLHPHMTKEGLVKLLRLYSNHVAPKDRTGPCSTYDQAILHNLLPLLLEKLEKE